MSLQDAIAEHITRQKKQQESKSAKRNAELAANYRGKSEPQSLEEAIAQTYPSAKTLDQMNTARLAR